jgi:nucleotide-binding universal stress UspA family protein
MAERRHKHLLRIDEQMRRQPPTCEDRMAGHARNGMRRGGLPLIEIKRRLEVGVQAGRIYSAESSSMLNFNRILVAIDGSPTSNKALAAAVELARSHGWRSLFVHSADELQYMSGLDSSAEVGAIVRTNGEKVLKEAASAAAAAGVEAECHLVDEPGQRLGDIVAHEALSWKADLVVVGTHGRHGVGRVLLGSGAEQIIRLSPVPALVIRADESV